jgi:hypothetical protein
MYRRFALMYRIVSQKFWKIVAGKKFAKFFFSLLPKVPAQIQQYGIDPFASVKDGSGVVVMFDLSGELLAIQAER